MTRITLFGPALHLATGTAFSNPKAGNLVIIFVLLMLPIYRTVAPPVLATSVSSSKTAMQDWAPGLGIGDQGRTD